MDTLPVPTIDAHHHFWRVAEQSHPWRSDEHTAIARDFLPDELAGHLAACAVDATVLVQSVDTAEENDRLAAFDAETPFVAGVVAWLPLLDPVAAAAELQRLDGRRVNGVRCLVGRIEIGRLAEPDAMAVFAELARRGVCWDVVPVTVAQTRTVLRVADEVPDLRVVVDHLARPPLDGADWSSWERTVHELAGRPNIAMKVSVGIDLLPRTGYEPDRLARAVAHVADELGPARMMLASNWPVVLLRHGYQEVWDEEYAAVSAAGIEGADLADVRGGTATRWYGLGDSAVS